jgi:hypothetical protein
VGGEEDDGATKKFMDLFKDDPVHMPAHGYKTLVESLVKLVDTCTYTRPDRTPVTTASPAQGPIFKIGWKGMMCKRIETMADVTTHADNAAACTAATAKATTGEMDGTTEGAVVAAAAAAAEEAAAVTEAGGVDPLAKPIATRTPDSDLTS